MVWIALLKDKTIIDINDLIYSKINNHLDDLVNLSAVLSDSVYSVSFEDGTFNINGQVLRIGQFTGLHDIRPICFRREVVQLSTGTLQASKPTITAIGLGYQGNDSKGRNHKSIILIYPDGTVKIDA